MSTDIGTVLTLTQCSYYTVGQKNQTYLRCSGMFKYEFVANLPLSLSVKEFWKSVDICGSYGQEFSVWYAWLVVYVSDLAVILWSCVLSVDSILCLI